MENNKILVPEDEQSDVSIRFSSEEEKEYYLGLKGQLIKLLYLIEEEQRGVGSAELYLYGFIYELKSANIMCKNKLTKACVKIYGLSHENQYKNMTHDEIKRQIFECKGIVDHLIKEMSIKTANNK